MEPHQQPQRPVQDPIDRWTRYDRNRNYILSSTTASIKTLQSRLLDGFDTLTTFVEGYIIETISLARGPTASVKMCQGNIRQPTDCSKQSMSGGNGMDWHLALSSAQQGQHD